MNKLISLLVLVSFSTLASDNEIFVDQVGATANIDLEQLGSGNIIGGLLATAGGASFGTFMWYSDALLTTSIVNGPVLSGGNAVGVASHIFYVVEEGGSITMKPLSDTDYFERQMETLQPFLKDSGEKKGSEKEWKMIK